MSNKKTEGSLTLKLRFPEFRESSEWEKELLGDVYSFQSTNSFPRDKLNYENGSVKNIHYGDIHTKFATLFDITKENVPFVNPLESLDKIAPESYCVEGDIVFADASEDMEDVGKSIELVYLNNEKLLAGMHTLLARQKVKRIIVGFGGYLFKSNRMRSQIKKEAQGAKVYGISANRLLNIDICFPADKKEQQKIADCLTSLDELIAAERAQLDALKTYKKELLQNLFPTEGESLPKLRFPEFQSTGEWEEKTLGDLGKLILGLTYSPSDKRDNGLLVLRSSNIRDGVIVLDDCVYVTPDIRRANLSKPNDILICVRNGSTALIGKNAIIPEGMPLCTHGAFMTVFRAENPKFAYQLLQTKAYQIQVAAGLGARINSINNSQLLNYAFFVPTPPEQQKIAGLLTSIDEEIAGQGQRVAALQVHKQGLLQGLFPSI